MISFFVPGPVATQGSKRHVGRGIMVESCKSLMPWRSTVKLLAAKAVREHPSWNMDGVFEATIVMYLQRPQSHYGTGKNAGKIKLDAPRYVGTKPDGEKVERAVYDALSKIAMRDDCRIVKASWVKYYANDGEQVGANITLGEVSPA